MSISNDINVYIFEDACGIRYIRIQIKNVTKCDFNIYKNTCSYSINNHVGDLYFDIHLFTRSTKIDSFNILEDTVHIERQKKFINITFTIPEKYLKYIDPDQLSPYGNHSAPQREFQCINKTRCYGKIYGSTERFDVYDEYNNLLPLRIECNDYKRGYCKYLDKECNPKSIRCTNPTCKKINKNHDIIVEENSYYYTSSIGTYNYKYAYDPDKWCTSVHICFSDKYSNETKCPMCGSDLSYKKLNIEWFENESWKCCVKDRIYFIENKYRNKLYRTKTKNGADIIIKDENSINIYKNEIDNHKVCVRCGKPMYYNGYCWECYKKYKHIGNK